MSIEETKNFVFENDTLRYESYLRGFSESLFNEFDAKSNALNLKLKIENLINGAEVNFTESQAAWHPKYRKDFNSKTPFQGKTLDYKNIVILGIGGSFEGPKL